MSSVGDNICEYCGLMFEDYEIHDCDIEGMQQNIDGLHSALEGAMDELESAWSVVEEQSSILAVMDALLDQAGIEVEVITDKPNKKELR